MDLAAIVAIDFVYAIATLALISLGLAIVFGMMRIINLAHGEFMVMGSYSATVAVHHGINIWIAILVVAPRSRSASSASILERLIIRHLYGRMVETMLATWGLSLFVVGILTMIFGDITEGVPTPLPGITHRRLPDQRLQPVRHRAVARDAVRGLRHPAFKPARPAWRAAPCRTPTWLRRSAPTPRASMPMTFAFGAALAGLAGGVLAPVSGVFPTIGGSYIGRAFITVISGGAAPLAGTASASLAVRRHQPDRDLPDQSGLRRSGACCSPRSC